MSLAECVAATAAELGLPEKDVQQIADRLQKHRDRLKRTLPFDEKLQAALRKKAADEGEKARIAAALKKRHVQLNILKREEWKTDLATLKADGLSDQEAVLAKLVGSYKGTRLARKSVSARRAALEASWLGGMAREIDQQMPHILPLLRRPFGDQKPLLDDVVREMWKPGSTGSADAQKLGAIFAKYAEASRLELNRAGANIGKLDGWAPQGHDSIKVARAKQDDWVGFVAPLLDVERSFPDVDEAGLPKVLSSVYENIVTGRDLTPSAKQAGERLGPANMARSLEKHRVLHFKSADAQLAYNERFGRGHVFNGVVDHLHMAARKASVMQALGPNPQAFLDAALEDLRDGIRRGTGSAKAKEKALGKLAADLNNPTSSRLGKAFAEVTGVTHSLAPGHVSIAKFGAGIRSVESMAKLGGAVISSITDLATYAHAMRQQGKGMFRAQADAFKALMAGRGTREQRQIATLLGAGFDSMLGDIHSRFASDDGLPGIMSTGQNWFFKLSGLTWWTERLESAYARMSAAWLGENAGHGWADLPDGLRNTLGQHGIDEARWEIVRKATYDGEDGAKYLLPEKIAEMDDETILPIAAGRVADIKLDVADQWARLRQANRRDAGWVAGRVEKFKAKLERARQRLAEREAGILKRSAEMRKATDARITSLGEKLSQLAELHSATNVDRRTIGRSEGRIAEKAAEVERDIRALLDDVELKADGLSADFEALWKDRQDMAGTPQKAADFRERFAAARERLTQRMAKMDETAKARAASLDKRIAVYADKLSALSEAADAMNVSRRSIGRDEGRLNRRIAEMEAAIKADQREAEKLVGTLGKEFESLWQRRQDELLAWIGEMKQREALRNEALAKLPEKADERIAKAVDDVRRNLQLALHEYIADETSFGVVRADDRTRMMTTGGTQRGTALGEAMRYLMQFKTFPWAFSRKVIGRTYNRGDYAGLGYLIAASTVLGYAAMTAKDALKNRTPKDPENPATWVAAMLQGGGLGIYGDFLFSSYDRFGGTLTSKMAGPTIGAANDFAALWSQFRQGDAKASDAFNFALGNAPFLNLWWLRAGLDMAVLNNLQEMLSPGTSRRREQKMKKEYGQRYIFEPVR